MSVFDSLIGQDAAVADLKRAALAARQIAVGENRPANVAAMSHAWLFTGPPGSGRSLAARTLAAALMCEADEPGCGICAGCKAAMSDNHPDLTTITTDAVTIAADEVRGVVAQSYVAPSVGFWRVFIIEDADRMVTRTSNVLLKAIEEPSEHTVWMLCTAAPADVLPTIRSRCRNVNLVTPEARLVAELIAEREGVDFEAALIAATAAQSHVGVARALAVNDDSAADIRKNTLDAVVSVHGVGDAVMAALKLLDPLLMRGEVSDAASKKAAKAEAEAEAKRKVLESYGLDDSARLPASVRAQVRDAIDAEKKKETRGQRDLLDRELVYISGFFRDVLVVQLGGEVELINADYREAIESIAANQTPQRTIAQMDAVTEARTRIAGNVAPLLAMEAALTALRH